MRYLVSVTHTYLLLPFADGDDGMEVVVVVGVRIVIDEELGIGCKKACVANINKEIIG